MTTATAVRTVGPGALVVVLAFALAATVPTSAGAAPTATCGGSGGGAIFVADSGFTVDYNDTQPMPAKGPFRGDDTVRFQKVTLSSTGDAFLRLEDGTGPETCLAAVDATPATVRVDPDGEQAVLIDGQVDSLSLADADYGQGSVDIAYEAGSSWTLTIPSTGLASGTEIVAEDGSGTELATGTVDSSGELVLALPAGRHDVDLREPTSLISVTSATTTTSEVSVGEPVDVTVELRNDGDASGSYTTTLTADGQTVTDRTVTVGANTAETVTLTTTFSQAGAYSLAVNGQDATEVTVTGDQSGDDTDGGNEQDSSDGDDGQDSSDESGPPWLIILGLVVVLAGGGGYAILRRDKNDST